MKFDKAAQHQIWISVMRDVKDAEKRMRLGRVAAVLAQDEPTDEKSNEVYWSTLYTLSRPERSKQFNEIYEQMASEGAFSVEGNSKKQ